MRIFLLATTFFYCINPTTAQTRCKLYDAYISSDRDKWDSLIGSCKTSISSFKLMETRIFAIYGYIGLCIEDGDLNTAKELLNVFSILFNQIKKAYPTEARSIIPLMSSYYAYSAYLKPMDFISNSYACLQANKLNLDSMPESPHTWTERGHMFYHLPFLLGGDKNKAIQCYEKALHYFEQSAESLNCNWYYLNTIVWLAKSYEAIGQMKFAIETYDLLIEKEPNFEAAKRWRKRLLLQQK